MRRSDAVPKWWSRGARQRLAVLPLLLAPVMNGCARVADHVIAEAISAPAADVAARHGADPMPGDRQTLMTRLRPARRDDATRASRLADQVRGHVARYRDISEAERAGYRSFPPAPPRDLRIVHYVHQRRSAREAKQVDPSQPGALLYERTNAGALRLVGAMFTAPVDASLEELDRRVPLSITQWHLHENICIPKPVWSKAQWERTADGGKPLFGPGSPIATEAACTAVGGRFLPTVFGWMAHIHVFAENPTDLWNAMYGHGPSLAPAGEHRRHE